MKVSDINPTLKSKYLKKVFFKMTVSAISSNLITTLHLHLLFDKGDSDRITNFRLPFVR